MFSKIPRKTYFFSIILEEIPKKYQSVPATVGHGLEVLPSTQRIQYGKKIGLFFLEKPNPTPWVQRPKAIAYQFWPFLKRASLGLVWNFDQIFCARLPPAARKNGRPFRAMKWFWNKFFQISVKNQFFLHSFRINSKKKTIRASMQR